MGSVNWNASTLFEGAQRTAKWWFGFKVCMCHWQRRVEYGTVIGSALCFSVCGSGTAGGAVRLEVGTEILLVRDELRFILWVFWGFYSGVAQDSGLVGCNAASLGDQLPAFGRTVSPSSARHLPSNTAQRRVRLESSDSRPVIRGLIREPHPWRRSQPVYSRGRDLLQEPGIGTAGGSYCSSNYGCRGAGGGSGCAHYSQWVLILFSWHLLVSKLLISVLLVLVLIAPN